MRSACRFVPLCLTTLAIAGCRESVAPEDPGPIVVAATFSETGRFASVGSEVVRGYRLGVEMLNESGGVAGRRVTLVLRDDASDPARGAGIYGEYVATDTIDLLLGPYSSPITDAVVDVTEAAGFVLVAPMAAAPTIWTGRNRRWSVQMLNPGPTYLQGSVELAAGNGARTAAVVYEDSPFPTSVAEGIRKAILEHGMQLVLDQPYAVNGADHEALATAALDAGADLFVGGGYYDDAVAFTRAVPAVGYRPMLVSLNLGPAQTSFARDLGDLARCVSGNAPWVSTIRTSGFIADSQTMVGRYEAAHGVLPSYYAAGGFGAVELLAEAVDATTTDMEEIDAAAVRDYLFSVSTETVLGPFSVYPMGNAQAGAQQALKGVLVQWQDDGAGRLVQKIVHPPAVADAEVCWGR